MGLEPRPPLKKAMSDANRAKSSLAGFNFVLLSAVWDILLAVSVVVKPTLTSTVGGGIGHVALSPTPSPFKGSDISISNSLDNPIIGPICVQPD